MNLTSNSFKARIIVTSEQQGSRTYDLNDGEKLNLGREPSNDIVIQDNRVSRVHACFFCRGTKCFASDLYSRNGTIVNGEPLVGDLELHNKDVINIGSSVIVIEIGPSESKQIKDEVTSTGGFSNVKIASAMFRFTNPVTPLQWATLENAIKSKSGQILLRNSTWVVAGWPGHSLSKMASESLSNSHEILRQLQAGNVSLNIFVFTLSALLEGLDRNWKVDLLGDPKKICMEINEILNTFTMPLMAEQSIVKRLPAEWKTEIVATYRMKNDFQPRTVYNIVSDANGAILEK